MPHTPITRDQLRHLKAEKEEAERRSNIEIIVDRIYNKIINVAKNTTETIAKIEIPYNKSVEFSELEYSSRSRTNINHDKDYYITNMEDILQLLRSLFPDCSVVHTFRPVIRGQDGKEHDVNSVDASVLQFVKVKRLDEAITVDWS